MRHIVRTHVVILEHRISSMSNAQRTLIDNEVGAVGRSRAPLARAGLVNRRDRDQVRIRGFDVVVRAHAPAVRNRRRDDEVLMPCVLNAVHAMDHGDTVDAPDSHARLSAELRLLAARRSIAGVLDVVAAEHGGRVGFAAACADLDDERSAR